MTTERTTEGETLGAVITDAATLGAVLREARRAAKETTYELADAAGYNQAVISNVERGQSWDSMFRQLAAWNRLLGRYGMRLELVLVDTEDETLWTT